MMEWTIQDIISELERTGCHYFDKGTLAFFGQRISDFKVYKGGGRVFVFADTHRGWGNGTYSSFAEFDLRTSKMLSVPKTFASQWTRGQVGSFVKRLDREQAIS